MSKWETVHVCDSSKPVTHFRTTFARSKEVTVDSFELRQTPVVDTNCQSTEAKRSDVCEVASIIHVDSKI